MIYLLHNIGKSPSSQGHIASNYNTREEIEALPEDAVLTFDGIYENVWKNRDILEGKNVILFVMGDYIGKNNSFDKGMPLEKYCNEEQLQDLLDIGCKYGYHTASHPDLTKVSREQLIKEVTPQKPTKYFAYPYGKYNDEVVQVVRDAGYEEAYSVIQGNEDPMTLRRDYI